MRKLVVEQIALCLAGQENTAALESEGIEESSFDKWIDEEEIQDLTTDDFQGVDAGIAERFSGN